MRPGMTVSFVAQRSAFSRSKNATEVSKTATPKEGTGNAGCSGAPAASCAKNKTHEFRHHRYAATIRHSLRDGLHGLICALPGVPGLLATVAGVMRKRHRQRDPQRRGIRTTRFRRTLLAALVFRATASVHRIPRPTSVTIAIRPSFRRGTGGVVPLICPTSQPEKSAAQMARRANHPSRLHALSTHVRRSLFTPEAFLRRLNRFLFLT